MQLIYLVWYGHVFTENVAVWLAMYVQYNYHELS